MKNLKKVLALVLAFACAFTMFAGAVVYPDVPAGSEYSEAITMLSDLGIIQGKDDGKYHSEDTITRAEACALIARMLTGDPQVSQYAGASNFTDVVKGSWKESVVGYCVVNGITVGVGNNKFEPDRAITDAEFVTMVVRAMGYETTGTSYPYGHISAAQANGLLDDVTVVPSSAALRGEDAQIIYNALFADYARGAKQVNTTHGTTVEEYPTIAEDVFGLYRAAAGTWGTKDGEDVLKNCKAHTWVITDQMKYNNKTWIVAYPIEDDDTDLYDIGYDDRNGYAASFEYDGDIDSLKGYQVELWGEGQHGEPTLGTVEAVDEDGKKIKEKVYAYDWEIKAVKTVKGQTAYAYTPADEELPDVDNDEVRGFVGGTVLKANDQIVLGSKTLPEKDVEGALQTKNSASYTLIDWDSDGATDFIVGDIYDYYKVESVTKKTVKLVGVDGEKFTLDLDGKTDIFDYFTIKAELPSDLEEGDILEVSTSEPELSKKNCTWTWTVKVVDVETKELTKVDTKKGAYFDDELIHDAEKYNGTKYYFDNTDAIYDGLNEKSEDDWDLYRDANGFIIFMEVADESWTGYIYVTGASNGSSSTGNRGLAEVSGVNDKNEYMEDVKLEKNADVKGFYNDDNRTFSKNPKGHVFHYAMNDDGQITKMVEVAKAGKADYTFTDKTDAVRVDNYNYWLDDCDVIFAVETTGKYAGEYGEYGNDDNENKVWDATDTVKVGTQYAVDGTDLSHKNVIAVSVDEIPDIDGDKTTGMGIRYDGNKIKDKDGAVVLGVDTLRYFSHTSVKVGLLTNLTSNRKDDTYTATAYVAGMDETEFTTIDEDDVVMNSGTSTKLSELYQVLTTNADAKYGIYCEFEFDKDGKITALTPMDDAYVARSLIRHTNVDGIEINTIDEASSIPATYKVMRVAVNKVTSDKALTVSQPKATSEDNKIYTVKNAQFVGSYDLKDSTEYFKITEKKVNMTKEANLNPYIDGFKKDFEIEDGSVDELDPYIRNNNNAYEDEYVVADVILNDDDDVVAVYYYDKMVGEYGYLKGTLALSAATKQYSGAAVNATVTCNDVEVDKASVALVITDANGDQVGASISAALNNNNTATVALPKLSVGTYTVTARGLNKAADEYQQIGVAQTLTVNKDTANVMIIENRAAITEKTSIDEGETVVYVCVKNSTANNAGVTGLTAADFKAQNLQNLQENVIGCEAGWDDGVYKLTLKNPVVVGDAAKLTIYFNGTKTLAAEKDDVTVVAVDEPSTAIVLQCEVNPDAGNTINVKLASDKVFGLKDQWVVKHQNTRYNVEAVYYNAANQWYTLTMPSFWNNAGAEAGSITVQLVASIDGVEYTTDVWTNN